MSTSGSPISRLSSTPAVASASQVIQLQLFDGWFAQDSETENSRTLGVWDVLPWRILSHSRGGKVPEVIVFESVRVNEGKEVTLFLTPAILRPKIIGKGLTSEPKATASAVLFPGIREELVERALRKLAVQQTIESRVMPDATNGSLTIEIVFSLQQLRAELERTEHGFTVEQIREALQVMHLCNVAVECPNDGFLHGKSGAILPTLEFVRRSEDAENLSSLYRATFHPLANAAILGQFYHPVNYARVMKLMQPLSRWIATLLNVRFRYATRGIGKDKRSFRLTLKRILSDSGITPEPRMRDNVERVRAAVQELLAAGFLDRGLRLEDFETIQFEKTRGRPKIINAEWLLYPSDRFAREILEGNTVMRNAKKPLEEKPKGV